MQTQSGDLSFWRTSLKHRNIALDDLHWVLDDGSSIDAMFAMYDHYVPGSPLQTILDFIHPRSSQFTQKRWEYRPSTSPNGIGMWHAETHFTLADLYHLRNYSIATGRTQCATLGCWTSGLLYNKSTLQAERPNTSCATFPMDMPLVPTLPLHPKIQFFVWHMLHGGINTCTRLHKFLPEISPECLCHCLSEETLDDLFAHSSFAKLVWQHFPHYLPNPTQYHTARYRFWNTNPSACAFGLVLLLYLWKARNSYLFQTTPLHPYTIHAKAISLLQLQNVSNKFRDSTWCGQRR